jgi:hypothetical protein
MPKRKTFEPLTAIDRCRISTRDSQRRRRKAIRNVEKGYDSEEEVYNQKEQNIIQEENIATAETFAEIIEDPITNSENKQPNEDCSTDDYDSENEYELEYEDSNTITMDQGIQYSPYVDKPLYDGCTITIFNAMIMILYFVVSSSISFSHVTKLLLLISYLLPCENRLKKTKHLFYKYFQDYLPHMKRFHCCLYCRKVSDRGKVCQYCKKSFGGHFLYQSTLQTRVV